MKDLYRKKRVYKQLFPNPIMYRFKMRSKKSQQLYLNHLREIFNKYFNH